MLAARLVDVEYDVALKITEDFVGQQVVEVSQTCWFLYVILHFSVRINCDRNMFSEKNGVHGLCDWRQHQSIRFSSVPYSQMLCQKAHASVEGELADILSCEFRLLNC